jgi:hypothetical protein
MGYDSARPSANSLLKMTAQMLAVRSKGRPWLHADTEAVEDGNLFPSLDDGLLLSERVGSADTAAVEEEVFLA